MTAYASDTWYTPIVLTPGTDNVIVITEDPGGGTESVITLTLIQNSDTASTDAETWYLHDDESFHATKPGLLYAIRKLLTSGTTVGAGTKAGGSVSNTYTWSVADPSTSSGLTNNGLKLTAASASKTWEISWTHASTTLDAHYFGSILSSPILDDASSTSGADEVFTWPHATKGRMATRDISDGHATDKVRHRYKLVQYSSNRPSDSVAVVWDEGYIRRIRYELVPGVEVHNTRSNESEWAATTTRGTGDEKATWFDVWDALTDAKECIVVHNDTSDLQIDTHKYEVVKLWEPLEWDAFAQDLTLAGDYYAINLPVAVTAGNYDH